MAGEARTNSFVLSTATVMIGPQGTHWDMTPTNNSIGLVKNFKCESTPTYVDLTQGPKGQVVTSVMTAHPIKATMEVFEFTTANLSWGLGLNGYQLAAALGPFGLSASLTGNDTTPVTTLVFNAPTDCHASFPTGTWIMIQSIANPDHVHYARLSADATGASHAGGPTYDITVTFANYGLKTGNNFSASDRVSKVNAVNVGSLDEQPFLSAKVTAVLPASNAAMTLIIPKLRIIKGFNLAFTTDTFANLPFEFQPYTLLPTDPDYATFGGSTSGMLFITS